MTLKPAALLLTALTFAPAARAGVAQLDGFCYEYVSSPELRIPCPDFRKGEIVEQVRRTFMDRYRVIDIDGARIYFDGGAWALIRASNTQPRLSLRFEARSERQLHAIKQELGHELSRYLPDVDLD